MPKLKWPKWWRALPIQLGVMLGFNFVACAFNLVLVFISPNSWLHIILVCVHGFLTTRYWRDLNAIWAIFEEHSDNGEGQGPV